MSDDAGPREAVSYFGGWNEAGTAAPVRDWGRAAGLVLSVDDIGALADALAGHVQGFAIVLEVDWARGDAPGAFDPRWT